MPYLFSGHLSPSFRCSETVWKLEKEGEILTPGKCDNELQGLGDGSEAGGLKVLELVHKFLIWRQAPA
jgi:hypothetical protein